MKTRPTFDNYVLTEALRAHENAQGEAVQDSPLMNRSLLGTQATIEQKILQRGRALGQPLFGKAISRTRYRTLVLLTLLLAVGVLAGMMAAASAFNTSREEVNIFSLMLALLGLNFFSLSWWFLSFLTTKESTFTGGRDWLQSIATKFCACSSAGGISWLQTLGSKPVGRWSFAVVSHAMWLFMLSGSLITATALLMFRQYDFIWETTLLNEQTLVSLAHALTWLPAKLGINVPDAATILASRPGAAADVLAASRQAWATLLLIGLLCYGIVPRLLLLELSFWRQGKAMGRVELDLSLPYYIELRQQLSPLSRSTGIIDKADIKLPDAVKLAGVHIPLPEIQNARYLGLDLDQCKTQWPPTGIDSDANLGITVDAQSQQHALVNIDSSPEQALILVSSLLSSPDRGMARYLKDIQGRQKGSLWLALSNETQLRQRLDDQEVLQRIGDWYQIAQAAGLLPDNIIVHEMQTEPI
ncbi:MAG: DUF2868 domain-containing protein [Pseudomonadales bacterium]